EQKVQAKAEREAKRKKRKWENFQGGNNNRNNYHHNQQNNKNNYRDNTCQHQQNNQRQGNARAMTTAQNKGIEQAGPTLNCNCYGVCHFVHCPIKCNKRGKIGHKARDCRGKVVSTGENTQPIMTCYECGEIGHTRNRCSKRNNPQGGKLMVEFT
ncbi:putative reverse transcriptase domain-containing protein, partial [Tanacetum coccineum]